MHTQELILHTHHVADQKAFYCSTLSLPLLVEAPDSFMVQVGTTRLLFQETQQDVLYHVALTIPVLATWYIRLKKTVLISLSFVFLVIFFERMCQVANTSVDAHDRIDHSCLTLSVNVLTRVSSHLLLARKHLTHNKSERYFVSCMVPVQTRYHFSLEVANCRH